MKSHFQDGMVVAGNRNGMAWERHGMCETITTALRKSNRKDKISLSGTPWQETGMGMAWFV
jgi:hypothetical protein